MIRLSKKSLDKEDDSIELVGQDGYIHIAGMRFSTTKAFGWYLDGCINGNHPDSVTQLTNLLFYKNTTLCKEAKKYKGYLGSGMFPEFDTRENLLKFAKHLQSQLGY